MWNDKRINTFTDKKYSPRFNTMVAWLIEGNQSIKQSIQHYVTRSCVRYDELFNEGKADSPVVELQSACDPAPTSANMEESQSAS